MHILKLFRRVRGGGGYWVLVHPPPPPPGKKVPLRNVQKRRESSAQMYRQKRMCTFRSRPMHCWPTTPNIVGPNNVVTCCVRLHGRNHNNVGTCWHLLRTASLKPVKLLAQQVPTFLLFCDQRSVAQQCCVCLHGTATMWPKYWPRENVCARAL